MHTDEEARHIQGAEAAHMCACDISAKPTGPAERAQGGRRWATVEPQRTESQNCWRLGDPKMWREPMMSLQPSVTWTSVDGWVREALQHLISTHEAADIPNSPYAASLPSAPYLRLRDDPLDTAQQTTSPSSQREREVHTILPVHISSTVPIIHFRRRRET